MTQTIVEWGLRYPGVKKVDHVYFYCAAVADEETRRSYLERADLLGRDLAVP